VRLDYQVRGPWPDCREKNSRILIIETVYLPMGATQFDQLQRNVKRPSRATPNHSVTKHNHGNFLGFEWVNSRSL
jgi:hypothetical protein